MTKPIIFSIDDDPQVSRAINRDLKSQYNSEYKIISTTSANEALEALSEMKNAGDPVAMFLVDQRMPEMEGVDFLQKAIKIYPDAKRGPFDRNSLRDIDDAGARRTGVRDARHAARNHRHDIDDRAAALGIAPAPRCLLHHVPGTVEIGVDDGVPALR